MDRQTRHILIRTDGNESIATGHLTRCLAIAAALTDRGARVSFAVADRTSGKLLQQYLLSCPPLSVATAPPSADIPAAGTDDVPADSMAEPRIHVLGTDYRDPMNELPALSQVLASYERSGFPVDAVLIDSYFVTAEYLQAIHDRTAAVYIDDLYAFPYPVDCVINYDLRPEHPCYARIPLRLLGPGYTPLRAQFAGTACAIRDEAQNIFISAGGADRENMTGWLLSGLLSDPRLQDARFHVMIGAANRHGMSLRELLRASRGRMSLYENLSDPAPLMRSCDLALTAAGTSLCELAALGVPAVSFILAENQRGQALDYEALAGVPCLGDAHRDDSFIRQAADALLSLMRDQAARKRLSERMHALVDGGGAGRIADAILHMPAAPGHHDNESVLSKTGNDTAQTPGH